MEVAPWGREVSYTSPTGVETKLYNIGTLSTVLGRTPQTIRKWEVGGTIPKTPFKGSRGERLYCTEHIEAIQRCAERAKIKQGTSISQTSFSTWVYKEFDLIHKKLFGDTKDN